MRLRTVIFGVYVLSSAVGFAILMAIMLWEVRPRYVESMRRNMEESAHLMSVLLEARLRSHPELEAARGAPAGPEVGYLWREELAALQKVAGRMRVYVTDHRGILIGDSAGNADIGQDYTRRPEMEAYFKKIYKGDTNTDLVRGELRVSVPMIIEGQTVAFVGVGRALNSVQQFILQARIRLSLEALAVAGVMIFTGWWIANRVAASIERLTYYARADRTDPEARPPVSMAKEITELGTAFETLRRELEGKAYVENYTQGLAHEIKAPLSSIRGAAELLSENPPTEDRERFLRNLCNETERLGQIVDRLLQLSSLEARRGRHERGPVNLKSLLESLADSAASSGQARGKRILIECQRSVEVLGEYDLLRQALENLLQNALEFSPLNGVISLSVEKNEDGALVIVKDEGTGIPEYALPRVFERFYSLPRPGSSRKSSGLGLNLVAEVARIHGGRAGIANRPEGGVCATLLIPLKTPS